MKWIIYFFVFFTAEVKTAVATSTLTEATSKPFRFCGSLASNCDGDGEPCDNPQQTAQGNSLFLKAQYLDDYFFGGIGFKKKNHT